jgi:hypothetical protein
MKTKNTAGRVKTHTARSFRVTASLPPNIHARTTPLCVNTLEKIEAKPERVSPLRARKLFWKMRMGSLMVFRRQRTED